MHIGVDIGGTHFSVGLLDNEYNIIQKEYVKVNENDESKIVISKILGCIKTFMEYGNVLDIGLALPCVCNLETDNVDLSTKGVWKDIDVITLLKKEFDIPVYFDNDANCATIASMYLGELKNVKNGLFVTIGTGIGSGIVINHNLHRGCNYMAGEIGHTCLVFNGKECGCGNKGCFEQYASTVALRKMLKEENCEYENLEKVFSSNDEKIVDITERWLQYLSEGLASCVKMLDITDIVIGGGISEYYEQYSERLEKLINEKIIKNTAHIKIHKSNFLNDAGIIGAALLGKELNIYE